MKERERERVNGTMMRMVREEDDDGFTLRCHQTNDEHLFMMGMNRFGSKDRKGEGEREQKRGNQKEEIKNSTESKGEKKTPERKKLPHLRIQNKLERARERMIEPGEVTKRRTRRNGK